MLQFQLHYNTLNFRLNCTIHNAQYLCILKYQFISYYNNYHRFLCSNDVVRVERNILQIAVLLSPVLAVSCCGNININAVSIIISRVISWKCWRNWIV